MTTATALVPIAPGRLFVMMSAEFRDLTTADCGWCRMPLMKVTPEPNAKGGHWTLRPAPVCTRCKPVLDDLEERYASRYDVWPVFADSWLDERQKKPAP